MSVESWAQVICQRELQQVVVIHDDQSESGMYDLRVGPRAAPAIAIECVRAMDRVLTELWNVGPARGALTLAVAGDWIVTVTREARMKRLTGLEPALLECERLGIPNVHVDWWFKSSHADLASDLERLGITWANCVRPEGAGKVYVTLDAVGGMVDEEGVAVVGWIGDFLRAPEQADVLRKLERSNAAQCHVVVPVGWSGAPWPVDSYLMNGIDVLPAGTPDLPQPVNSVWIVSMHAAFGIRWDGAQWYRFDARMDSVAA